MLERLWQKSGFDILLTLVIAWVAADLLEWIGLLNLPTPWDGIAKKAGAVVVAFLRLRFLATAKPTMRATELPPSAVRQLPAEQREVVAAAIERQAEKGTVA